jgi:hypothetical protein
VTRPARPASIVLSSALLAGAAIGCSDRRSEWYFVDQRGGQFGPFATKVDCERIQTELEKLRGLVTTSCWEGRAR